MDDTEQPFEEAYQAESERGLAIYYANEAARLHGENESLRREIARLHSAQKEGEVNIMWAKIKANPAAVIALLAVGTVGFLLHIPAVKASQYHEALEWAQTGLGGVTVLFIKALFGAEADAVQKALAQSAADKAKEQP